MDAKPDDPAGRENSDEEQQAEALAISIALAGLAGWTDGLGFITFHGLFVSFMSGNTTTLGSTLGFDAHAAADAGRAVAAFVAGAVVGELAATLGGTEARAIVLGLATLALSVAALAQGLHLAEFVTAPLLSLAMGIETAAVHKAEGMSIALTYVTGTLVNIGRRIAKALRGAGPWRAALPYIGLWLAFLGGAIGGSLSARHSPLVAMIAAAGTAGALTLWTLIQARVWHKAVR